MMNPAVEALAIAVAAARQDAEASAAAASFYGYGEQVEGSSVDHHRFQGEESGGSSGDCSVPSSVPGSPLPAERLARKQRNFPRRGGYCHSALLKSAVLACMSDGPENRYVNNNSPGGMSSSGDLSVSDLFHAGAASSGGGATNSSSPRKRMRRTDHATITASKASSDDDDDDEDEETGTAESGNHNCSNHEGGDEAIIARATDLLQRLCVKSLDQASLKNRRGLDSSRSRQSRDGAESGDFERKAPVRRVSRRTSYTSQISSGTDYEQLEEDELFL